MILLAVNPPAAWLRSTLRRKLAYAGDSSILTNGVLTDQQALMTWSPILGNQGHVLLNALLVDIMMLFIL